MSLHGQVVELRIDALDDRARGVGSHPAGDEPTAVRVTVPGVVPGEIADVRVTWQHKKLPLAHGRARELRVADPARIDAPCPRHDDPLVDGSGQCGGCPLLSVSIERQHALKLERVREALGIPVEAVVAGPTFGYRWSAKRLVGGQPGALVLGSRRPRDARVADMAGCLVDHPSIVDAAAELRTVANELGIEPYLAQTAEQPASGDLRYVWFKTDGQRVLLTLIVRSEATRAAELARALKLPAGIAVSVQSDGGNTVRGSGSSMLAGLDTLRVSFAGLDGSVQVGPLGFLQPNPAVAGRAYAALVEDLDAGPDDGRPIYDLYAGAGLTTQWLRSRFEHVEPCEAYPESAAGLGVRPSTAEAFLKARVQARARPSVVLANPPRGGLGDEVCALLRELAAPTLRIMSCRAETLARDLQVLCADGGPGVSYRLTRATAYDTLPHTAHLEIVVWLRRVGAEGGARGDLRPGGFAPAVGD